MANAENNNAITLSKKNKSLLAGIAVFIVLVAAVAILGLVLITPPAEITQGQADCDMVRVSGMMPGRVAKFYVQEGDMVHKGDTLASIYSSTVDAKLQQAKSMQEVAQATSQKAENGTRSEIKAGAYNVWQQAIAAETITQKTFQRMQNLYEQGVISEQKRDEARAAYEVAMAQVKAAKSQYDMACNGAQAEDKAAARGMANAARGGVMEVESILADQYLIAPCDGEVSNIYPKLGELIAMGAPVMSIARMADMWVSFNVREEMLNGLPMGKEVKVSIPALDNKEVPMKIYFIHDRGSYAAWSATKAYGQYDSKTFEIRVRPVQPIENFRPGMSAILSK